MGKNKQKIKQLNMSEGSASHKLTRKLMFDFITKANMADCYKCGKPMSVDTYSVEHKNEWMYSDDPIHDYFDINNIAYSHKKCNRAIRGKGHRSTLVRFKGIFLNTIGNRTKPWRAQVSYQGKRYNAGSYTTAEEAARAYDKKALELFGSKFITNEKLHLYE